MSGWFWSPRKIVIDVVVQKMSERKDEMIEVRPSGDNRQRIVFHAPTRSLDPNERKRNERSKEALAG